jgi:hypothetical protein
MVIIAPDASEMAESAARESRRVQAAKADGGAICLRKGPLKAAFDNKIETIQSVLRHFLREIGGAGLGKS